MPRFVYDVVRSVNVWEVAVVMIGALGRRRWVLLLAGVIVVGVLTIFSLGRFQPASTSVEPGDLLAQAQILYKKGKYAKAAPLLEEYLTVGKQKLPLARDLLISSYSFLKKYDKAAEQLKQSLRARPDDADTLFRLAVVEDKLRRPREALAHLKQAVTLAPDRVQFHAQLAEVSARLRRKTEAATEWRRVLELLPARDPYRATVESKISFLED